MQPWFCDEVSKLSPKYSEDNFTLNDSENEIASPNQSRLWKLICMI